MKEKEIWLEDLKGDTLLFLWDRREDVHYLLTKDEFLEDEIYKNYNGKSERNNYILNKAELEMPDFDFGTALALGIYNTECEVDEEWADGLVNTIPETMQKKVENLLNEFIAKIGEKVKIKFDEIIRCGAIDERYDLPFGAAETMHQVIPVDIVDEMTKLCNEYLKKNPSGYRRGDQVDW